MSMVRPRAKNPPDIIATLQHASSLIAVVLAQIYREVSLAYVISHSYSLAVPAPFAFYLAGRAGPIYHLCLLIMAL